MEIIDDEKLLIWFYKKDAKEKNPRFLALKAKVLSFLEWLQEESDEESEEDA